MPPRKKQATGAGPSSAPRFNAHKFRTALNEQRYELFTKGRSIIRERGFRLEEDEYEEIQTEIERRGWTGITRTPETARQSVVREFYANAWQRDDEEISFVSYVRGKAVDYSDGTINRLIGDSSARRGACEYVAFRCADPDYEEVVRELCRPGTAWVRDGRGYPKHVKKAELKPIPYVWYSYIISSVLPSKHHTEVILKRAGLVHCIVTEKWINLGGVLSRSIHDIAQETTTSLGHPSLITALCIRAGVNVNDDLPLAPEPPITASFIERAFKDYARRYGHEEGPEEAQPAPQPPPRQEAGPSRQRTVAQRLDRLERLMQQQIRNTNEHIRNSERREQYLLRCAQAAENVQRRFAEQLHLDPDEVCIYPAPPDHLYDTVNLDADDDDQDAAENSD